MGGDLYQFVRRFYWPKWLHVGFTFSQISLGTTVWMKWGMLYVKYLTEMFNMLLITYRKYANIIEYKTTVSNVHSKSLNNPVHVPSIHASPIAATFHCYGALFVRKAVYGLLLFIILI